ncbi:MAG: hypothetical protein GPOALKHO_000323 [Sodalis sp.]|uniref:hypothetical protein n=1 Tax=Sodalis sp. (in: enterobacteria) TaxID=1898979 RepID=UPI0038732ABC|nr:MAG: hypothetical protein GPOALKHO_000323 [Sodalis sp.]
MLSRIITVNLLLTLNYDVAGGVWQKRLTVRQRIAMLDCVRDCHFGHPADEHHRLYGCRSGLPQLRLCRAVLLSRRNLNLGHLRYGNSGEFLTLFALLFGGGLVLLFLHGTRWIRARLFWLIVWSPSDYGLGRATVFWTDSPGAKRNVIDTGIVLYLLGVVLLMY